MFMCRGRGKAEGSGHASIPCSDPSVGFARGLGHSPYRRLYTNTAPNPRRETRQPAGDIAIHGDGGRGGRICHSGAGSDHADRRGGDEGCRGDEAGCDLLVGSHMLLVLSLSEFARTTAVRVHVPSMRTERTVFRLAFRSEACKGPPFDVRWPPGRMPPSNARRAWRLWDVRWNTKTKGFKG